MVSLFYAEQLILQNFSFMPMDGFFLIYLGVGVILVTL